MRYGRDNWTIEVPPDWEFFNDPQCLTLDRPEGALQFSSAKKTDGSINMLEIERVATNSGSRDWGQPKEIRVGEFAGLLFDHVETDLHWRRWFLFQDSTLILVTFNSEVETSAQLWQEILAIVETLRLEPVRQSTLIHRAASTLRGLLAGRR
jgi:hypothetical protein